MEMIVMLGTAVLGLLLFAPALADVLQGPPAKRGTDVCAQTGVTR